MHLRVCETDKVAPVLLEDLKMDSGRVFRLTSSQCNRFSPSKKIEANNLVPFPSHLTSVLVRIQKDFQRCPGQSARSSGLSLRQCLQELSVWRMAHTSPLWVPCVVGDREQEAYNGGFPSQNRSARPGISISSSRIPWLLTK